MWLSWLYFVDDFVCKIVALSAASPSSKQCIDASMCRKVSTNKITMILKTIVNWTLHCCWARRAETEATAAFYTYTQHNTHSTFSLLFFNRVQLGFFCYTSVFICSWESLFIRCSFRKAQLKRKKVRKKDRRILKEISNMCSAYKVNLYIFISNITTWLPGGRVHTQDQIIMNFSWIKERWNTKR